MVSAETFVPTVVPLIMAIALLVIGIISFNQASEVTNSVFIRNAMLAVQPNFLALTYVTNNSDTSFCSNDDTTFFFYDISNYESIRNSTTGVAEFIECEYVLTRPRCMFDLALTTPVITEASPLFFPVEGTTPETVTHDFEMQVDMQAYYSGDFDLKSSTCDPDRELTLINLGYLRYVSKYSADTYAFDAAYSVVDDNPAREEQILYALFGQVFGATFADDQDLTDALTDAGVTLSLEQVRWLVSGQSDSRTPLVEYGTFYYSWYGYDIPANLSRALAYDNYYWINEGPGADPIPVFLELVDDAQSSDTNTSLAAQQRLLSVYDLSVPDAVSFAGFVNDFVATEVKAYALSLIEAGSGPVITRPYMDFIQLGSDPLMEAMGIPVIDLELFFWGTSSIAAMRPGGESTDRDGAGSFSATGYLHEALDMRQWHESMFFDIIDNGTVTAEDDGTYTFFAQYVQKSTENMVWSSSTLYSDARPNGQVDENGVEYTATVQKEKDGTPFFFWLNYAFRLDYLKLASKGAYETDGITVEQYGIDWEAMPEVDVNFAHTGLIPAKNLDRIGSETYYTPRGLKQADVFDDIVLENASPLFDDFSVFIHPETGIFSGMYFDITHVLRVGEYGMFDNHKLAAGFYPYGGGAGFSVYQRVQLRGGACNRMQYLTDVLDVTKCETIAGVEAANSMYLTAMVCVMVQACILFLVIIASFVSSLSS